MWTRVPGSRPMTCARCSTGPRSRRACSLRWTKRRRTWSQCPGLACASSAGTSHRPRGKWLGSRGVTS
eukprot:9478178-Pyramimonas_sp.AAC.1